MYEAVAKWKKRKKNISIVRDTLFILYDDLKEEESERRIQNDIKKQE